MQYIALFLTLSLVIGCSPKIYEKVDDPALFAGCSTTDCHERKVAEFVHKHRKFPKEMLEAGMEGVAVIRFKVSKDGQLSDFTIKNDPGHGMGAEALRIVQQMPRWIPAKVKEQAVDSMGEVKVPFYFE